MIEVIDLTKYYGAKQVLKNISVSFQRGKVYGIVGENGAGKTTLFRCIAGLESYTGQVKSEYPILKNQLGFLPTEPFFFTKITGWEYLQLLRIARKISVDAIAESNIFELPLEEYAVNYSTGMKKKLALTGVLLQRNEYFILDEPFNGVDIQSNMIITALIEKLKALDKIIIISSHIYATLSLVCDEIHLLSAGQIRKSVQRADFSSLEEEMKRGSIRGRIDNLKL